MPRDVMGMLILRHKIKNNILCAVPLMKFLVFYFDMLALKTILIFAKMQTCKDIPPPPDFTE